MTNRMAVAVAAFSITACGGATSDTPPAATATGAAPASAPAAEPVANPANFCVKSVSTLKVFALQHEVGTRAVSITTTGGLIAVGEHAIDAKNPEGVGASIVDRSTGTQPSEWQQYKAMSGTITITAADAKHVAGSYDFSAAPSYPKTTGDAVMIKGTFDAPPSASCDLAAAGVK